MELFRGNILSIISLTAYRGRDGAMNTTVDRCMRGKVERELRIEDGIYKKIFLNYLACTLELHF